MRILSYIVNVMFEPVWCKPILDSTDDGFCSWLVSSSGDRIIDVRYMSEQKRFWQYGGMLGVSE